MLQITIPGMELWDEVNEKFVYTKAYTLNLEHSLISLSKWESKWCKPFLITAKRMTTEETIDYIRCMTLTPNVPNEAYEHLTNANIDQVSAYIEAPMTATWFYEDKNGKKNRDVITAELIYYWMIALNIPFECQKWHLNKLLTLIRVCEIKNSPRKKQSMQEIMRRNDEINEQRKKQYNSKG